MIKVVTALFASLAFAFLTGSPATACETVPAPATYSFVNDVTAAGDLDETFDDNTDYADDALGVTCERELINVSAYGPDVYLYTCEGVRPV